MSRGVVTSPEEHTSALRMPADRPLPTLVPGPLAPVVVPASRRCGVYVIGCGRQIPVLLRDGPYRFYFVSGDQNEPLTFMQHRDEFVEEWHAFFDS